ncbi:bifunctional 5,10-methylene-tetrahydrofolate dehydrogenase/5,10-methylene-tetrahydrofolate cyclohydrolase [endosymbiont 'TC1' of Trimyema compressum]|uniref:bifunctional 5,10-methylenetetrahydrofolate dehydrogenase/5,10-methenyltetrahydrofolate cyclohydrolase n=1 Tax=endosymbiont 'TC1' of Trimyema compressum TaxID=243899 RepID=UPI0007F160E8|nr:bifunctional 5,10-methylenetetrahydrofolate dehydrogenase/5,10-methenyltetrahydrofolate cyclohydrolase [endosymbiont 'TC1' of Trimyema compressum]AMP20712.1 bifunctional 5,10-methylene-tetrahydrofolate dehydrogenase/5,10-methylene-tetrahydrofolate cyclohydrolase [endosymbiont 'TC1' of Trimyema compressum]
MSGQLLDGKAIAKEIRAEVKEEVAALRAQGIAPKMAVILVGDDPASVYYAQSKEKAANNVGIDFDFHNLPTDTKESDLLALIEKLNQDKGAHGIMVELPLPGQISTDKVMEAVLPAKDVDGIHPMNRGYILSNGPGLFPATPQSCIELMLRSGVEIEGKHAVIVGRGETVGKPLVFLLLQHNPTITICHSRTKDLASFVKQGDIVIAAVGRPNMITKEMVKPGAIVVDAGINEVEGGGYCGDVDFEGLKEVVSLISPVPGGVGSLTTSLIFKNLLKGISIQQSK